MVDQYLKSITTQYKHSILGNFIKAIDEYKLIDDGDKICVCISGGKDSMLMAKLFQLYQKHFEKKFEVEYIVMNPGYNKENLDVIRNNLDKLLIDAQIIETDIFQITELYDQKPCFLCAKMRRGALYGIAQKLGCNKIALGHHYDDVIETTMMNILYAGSIQTMLPKLHSDNYKGMQLIRPMYLIKEADIIDWKNTNDLTFINCACRLTQRNSEDHNYSARKKTKDLIKQLSVDDDQLEKNIFNCVNNIYLDKVLGYKKEGVKYSFLDSYDEESE